MVGMLARSKAGHDRLKVYMIIKEEADYVLLSDGLRKPLICPKRKKRKHIQVINKEPDYQLTKRLQAGEPVRDEEIKRTIKLYEQTIISASK